MAGVLEELRRAIIARDKVDIDDTSIIIAPSTRLDRKQPTNFHMMRGRGDAYPLESIFFQFKFRDMPYNDYIQACRREQVAHVTPLDKKDLLAFLTGEIDTCASIVAKPSDRAALRAKPPKPASVPATATADPAKASEDRAEKRTAADAELDRASYSAQRSRDRDQRALDSVLMVAEYDFSSLREKLSQHIANAKSGKNSKAENGSKPAHSTYDPRGDRYTSNEGRFWRENMGTEFQDLGIDMSGSFKAKPTSSSSAPNGSNASADAPRDRRDSRPRPSNEPAKRRTIDPKDLVPIIIVPTGLSLVFSGNAIQFFEHGRFMSKEEMGKRKVAPDLFGSSRGSVTRKPGGNCSRAEYIIIQNPNRLTTKEWDRVVAVVVSGQEWQFKNWPIYEKTAQDLFRRVQGFFFHYEDVSPTGNVATWNVKKLSLSRHTRHTDGQVQNQFWQTLDTFLRRKNMRLRY